MLAVLKAGGAFVPLDQSHPVERLRNLCHSVGASLILCSRHHVQTLAEVMDNILAVDDATVAESTLAESERNDMVTPGVSSSNVAYVIFTSGSTGTPKVSRHTHTDRLPMFLTFIPIHRAP